jgi:hypothetical protein
MLPTWNGNQSNSRLAFSHPESRGRARLHAVVRPIYSISGAVGVSFRTELLSSVCVPALLAGLFGFLRAKPKEMWSYGFLMWAPQAIRFGIDWATHRAAWFRAFYLVIVASSFLAAVVGVFAAYAGFTLRKISSRILAIPEEPPSILRS